MSRTRRTIVWTLCGAVLAGAVGCGAPKAGAGEAAPTDQRVRDAARLAARAEKALAKGEYAEAETLSRRALDLNSELPGVWNNLGVSLMEQERYMDAAQALKRAADLAPADPTPCENLGLVYYRAGFDEDALRWYSESLSRDPNWLPSIRGAVACATRLNRADDATRERIRRGLMLETEPQWREIFERQRLRVETQLDAAGRKSP